MFLWCLHQRAVCAVHVSQMQALVGTVGTEQRRAIGREPRVTEAGRPSFLSCLSYSPGLCNLGYQLWPFTLLISLNVNRNFHLLGSKFRHAGWFWNMFQDETKIRSWCEIFSRLKRLFWKKAHGRGRGNGLHFLLAVALGEQSYFLVSMLSFRENRWERAFLA